MNEKVALSRKAGAFPDRMSESWRARSISASASFWMLCAGDEEPSSVKHTTKQEMARSFIDVGPQNILT